MTCDVACNRLLALPDPTRPTDDLLPHLAGCAVCRAVQAEAVRLDSLLKRLPAPAPQRKAAFLEQLGADGPVIRTRPVVPSSLTGSGAFKPVVKWLKRIDWRYVGGGVAAAVAIGLGIWLLVPKGPKGPEETASLRSERLKRMVAYTAELAKARTPQERLGVYGNWSAELEGEAGDVFKVADKEDMTSLARKYEEMVNDGVVPQARQMKPGDMPPDARSQALNDAMKKLGDAQTEASRLAAEAPPNARDALQRIAKTAQEGRRTLGEIAQGK